MRDLLIQPDHLQMKLRWGLSPPKVTQDGKGTTQTRTPVPWFPGNPAAAKLDGLSFTIGATLFSFQIHYYFF